MRHIGQSSEPNVALLQIRFTFVAIAHHITWVLLHALSTAFILDPDGYWVEVIAKEQKA